MIFPINFDNQLSRQANKVCNVISYNMLSSKSYSTLRSTQGIPQYILCLSGMLAIFLRELTQQIIGPAVCRFVSSLHAAFSLSSRYFLFVLEANRSPLLWRGWGRLVLQYIQHLFLYLLQLVLHLDHDVLHLRQVALAACRVDLAAHLLCDETELFALPMTFFHRAAEIL